MLMLGNGRIAGISGILGGAVFTHKAESAWQITFVGECVSGSGPHRVSPD
jgi:uncharacterized membrane protein YedE/YeeE